MPAFRYTSSVNRPFHFPGALVRSPLRKRLALLGLCALVALLPACQSLSKVFTRTSNAEGYWLPLVVALRFDPSATDAALAYTDACGLQQFVPVGDRFTAAMKRDMALVFERVEVSAPGLSKPVDGVLDIALGLQEVDLFIHRKATKSYPAGVTVGGTVTYTDPAGTVLYSKNLRTEVRGTVETEARECAVSGLQEIANEAVATLSQGFMKQLGTSLKLREAANAAVARRGAPTTAVAQASALPTAPLSTPESAALMFRVMLREDRQNDRFESGEKIALAAEVSNVGGVPAKDVILHVSGTPALVQHLATAVTIGELKPNETKHVEISGVIPATDMVQQAEVILAVAAANAAAADQKKFLVEWHPAPSEAAVEDILLDRPPVIDPHRIGIAVGIGSYRKDSMPALPFAVRDAEVMVEYFQKLSGVPAERTRLLLNEHALKDDLIEVFEEWLPQQTSPASEVLIFLSAHGVIQPSGAVVLVPYEADLTTPQRLLSLRRLYDALSRLPAQRTVLMLDVSLLSDSISATGKEPQWGGTLGKASGGSVVEVIGVNGARPQVPSDGGRHSRLTAMVFKGLRGDADRDRDGAVDLSELCTYVQQQAPKATKGDTTTHDLRCLPNGTSAEKMRRFIVARLK